MKTKHLFLGIFLLMATVALQAQQSANAAGGDASGSGGSVAFSVGQISNQTSGSGTTVATGVQQPYEISIVTSLGESHQLNLEMKVFPNPTTDQITLEIEDYSTKNLTYYLIDMNGAILENASVNQNNSIIDMREKAAATYFLRVSDQDENFQTFKIIKTK